MHQSLDACNGLEGVTKPNPPVSTEGKELELLVGLVDGRSESERRASTLQTSQAFNWREGLTYINRVTWHSTD